MLPERDNGLFTVIAANNTVNAPGIPPKYHCNFILFLLCYFSGFLLEYKMYIIKEKSVPIPWVIHDAVKGVVKLAK